jgi:hypothetical protein
MLIAAGYIGDIAFVQDSRNFISFLRNYYLSYMPAYALLNLCDQCSICIANVIHYRFIFALQLLTIYRMKLLINIIIELTLIFITLK